MTPPMADAGLALAQAILAIIDNPKAVGEAHKAKVAAMELTEEQSKEYQQALQTIEQAKTAVTSLDVFSKRLEARVEQVEAREGAVTEREKLCDSRDRQDEQLIQAINAREETAGQRESDVKKREAACLDRDNEHVERVRAVERREAEAKRREDKLEAIASAAKKAG